MLCPDPGTHGHPENTRHGLAREGSVLVVMDALPPHVETEDARWFVYNQRPDVPQKPARGNERKV